MVAIRKAVFVREVISADAFGTTCEPICRIAAIAVISNPIAGRFERDLSLLYELGAQVGEQLASQAVAQLLSPAVSYGKAAIVGVSGDMEHGGAVVHPKLGAPMRAATGGARP